MLTTYVIDNTSGSLSFRINPGELDGPGGASTHSDFRLYGNGALKWGEGVDENILRLAETSSVARKETGDYNPLTGNFDFDSVNQKIKPKDEHDLGVGKGITRPLNGQLWHSSTTKEVYFYDEPNDEWIHIYSFHISTTAPLGPANQGDLWYDTAHDFGVCGSTLELPQLKLYDATNGWTSVGDNYLSKHGGWMDNILDMGGQMGYYGNGCMNCDDFSGNKIVNLGDPECDYDAAHKKYVDDENAKQGIEVEELAEIIQNHFNNRAGRVPTEDTTLTINGRVFVFEDNTHLTGNEETMLRSIDFSGTNYALQSGTSDVEIGQGLNRINYKLDKANGGVMTGWLNLRSALPSINDDWRAVPVKMLRDRLGSTVDGLNVERKILYMDEYSVNFGGAGSGDALLSFYFNAWISDYRSRTGDLISASQFRIVPIIYFRSFTVANSGKYESGSLGDYGYVIFQSWQHDQTRSSSGISYRIRLNLGAIGFGRGAEKSYSTGSPTAYHVVFIGGKSTDMVRYYNVV